MATGHCETVMATQHHRALASSIPHVILITTHITIITERTQSVTKIPHNYRPFRFFFVFWLQQARHFASSGLLKQLGRRLV